MTDRWLVTGRVQGVGYRAFVRREAEALGLTGWVANLADGTVEIEAQGTRPALDAFDLRLRIGPKHSAVASVVRSEISDERQVAKVFTVR